MTAVALNVDQAFFRVPGGTGTYVRELVRALPSADPTLRLSLFHARFEADAPGWMDGLTRHELARSIRTLYPSWGLTGRPPLPPEVARADVIHATSPVAVPPASKGQGLVVTVHDVAFALMPALFPRAWRLLFRLGLRRSAARADAIITVSRHTADDLTRIAKLPRDRIHVVPLAASLPPRPSDPADALRRVGVDGPYVLSVGTLEPRKNLVRLIRAYRGAVAQASLPHALVLVGPAGWGAEAIRHEAGRDDAGRVVLTGEVPPDVLDGLYRGADLFAYPSLYEGFGLPVLDAMARGVPTVASSSSAVPEVAGDAAVLVDPGSAEEIGSAIVRVLTGKVDLDRLASAGIERARSFSWDRTARETAAVYRKVA